MLADQLRAKESEGVAAYLVVDCEVTDAQRFETYKALVPALVARFGGRYLVRGGDPVPLEGDWTPGRMVIVEFPTQDAARKFFDSPDYRAARAAREGAANMRIVAVTGV